MVISLLQKAVEAPLAAAADIQSVTTRTRYELGYSLMTCYCLSKDRKNALRYLEQIQLPRYENLTDIDKAYLDTHKQIIQSGLLDPDTPDEEVRACFNKHSRWLRVQAKQQKQQMK